MNCKSLIAKGILVRDGDDANWVGYTIADGCVLISKDSGREDERINYVQVYYGDEVIAQSEAQPENPLHCGLDEDVIEVYGSNQYIYFGPSI